MLLPGEVVTGSSVVAGAGSSGGAGFEGFHSGPNILKISGLCMVMFWLMLNTLFGPPEFSFPALDCFSRIHFCSDPLKRKPSSQWLHILPSSPRHRKYDLESCESTALYPKDCFAHMSAAYACDKPSRAVHKITTESIKC